MIFFRIDAYQADDAFDYAKGVMQERPTLPANYDGKELVGLGGCDFIMDDGQLGLDVEQLRLRYFDLMATHLVERARGSLAKLTPDG